MLKPACRNYLPEGNLTHYEYEAFEAALAGHKLVNALDIVDRLSVIKDEGTINRFRKAGEMADAGHQAVYAAIIDGGFKKYTETQIAGHCCHGHARCRQCVGMVLHRRQRDRLRLPHRLYGRRLHTSHRAPPAAGRTPDG